MKQTSKWKVPKQTGKWGLQSRKWTPFREHPPNKFDTFTRSSIRFDWRDKTLMDYWEVMVEGGLGLTIYFLICCPFLGSHTDRAGTSPPCCQIYRQRNTFHTFLRDKPLWHRKYRPCSVGPNMQQMSSSSQKINSSVDTERQSSNQNAEKWSQQMFIVKKQSLKTPLWGKLCFQLVFVAFF